MAVAGRPTQRSLRYAGATFPDHQARLEDYLLTNRQPVQIFNYWGDVFTSAHSRHHTSSRVMHSSLRAVNGIHSCYYDRDSGLAYTLCRFELLAVRQHCKIAVNLQITPATEVRRVQNIMPVYISTWPHAFGLQLCKSQYAIYGILSLRTRSQTTGVSGVCRQVCHYTPDFFGA